MVQNKAIYFKNIPKGVPEKGHDLVVETTEFDLDDVPKNGAIAKVLYSSMDPYQRGRMRPQHVHSYVPAFVLNEPITNYIVVQVVASNSDKVSKGDLAVTFGPAQEYLRLDENYMTRVTRVDQTKKIDPKEYLGALGMPGTTAYSSFYEIGTPKKGETIFISAAAGAVGAIVGQLAKHEGLRVIGSVGSDDKLEYITKELGFDEGFNYKKESPEEALKRLAPKGIDIYYDNVGGETLQAAFDLMNDFGRVVCCGMISQYNLPEKDQMKLGGITYIVAKRLRVQGFIQGDENMGPKWKKQQLEKIGQWLQEGTFKTKFDVTEGIDNGIDALLGLFTGSNFGKAVLKISDYTQESQTPMKGNL